MKRGNANGAAMKKGTTNALGPKRSTGPKYGNFVGVSGPPPGGVGKVRVPVRPGSRLQKFTSPVRAGTGTAARPGGSQPKSPAKVGGTGVIARPGGSQSYTAK